MSAEVGDYKSAIPSIEQSGLREIYNHCSLDNPKTSCVITPKKLMAAKKNLRADSAEVAKDISTRREEKKKKLSL